MLKRNNRTSSLAAAILKCRLPVILKVSIYSIITELAGLENAGVAILLSLPSHLRAEISTAIFNIGPT